MNHFQAPHHYPLLQHYLLLFLNLVFRASFLLLTLWLPGDPLYPQSHSQSLPCFLHVPHVSLEISGSDLLPAEGQGEAQTHSWNQPSPIRRLPMMGLGLVWGTPAPTRPRDSHGLPRHLFFRHLWNPKNFTFPLPCRPGVPAVSCSHRLTGASPRSAPIDCNPPHCQARKLF